MDTMDTFDAIQYLLETKDFEYMNATNPAAEVRLLTNIIALGEIKEMLIDDAHEDAIQMNTLIDGAIHAALYELMLSGCRGDVRMDAKIHAIKAYRRVSGLGLAEAHSAVKKLRPDLFPDWNEDKS